MMGMVINGGDDDGTGDDGGGVDSGYVYQAPTVC